MTHSIFEILRTGYVQLPTTEGNEDHGELAYDATTFVNELLESTLSDLNRGVLTLTYGPNLDVALERAYNIRLLLPDLAIGFAHAASIYSAQGRQRQVIDICDQGLRVVDTQDTHYALLQRLRQDAVQRENIRIDPFKNLPYDILWTTLIPMLMNDDTTLDALIPCHPLHVSKVWRDCLIQRLGGLRFRARAQEINNLREGSQLSIFSRHIKSLCVPLYSQGTWLTNMIRRKDFPMLQELIIERFCTVSIDDFVSSLESISSTLTHFRTGTMDVQPNASVSPFTGVLLACPNLVSLEIYQPIDTDLCDLPKMTWPKLTTLAIVNGRKVFSCDEIRAICERFPSLKLLSIGSCSDLLSIPIIHQYYPSMRSLQVVAECPLIHLRYSDEGPDYEEPGITNLAIWMDQWNHDEQPVPDIGVLLKQHHHTVESIVMRVHTAVEDPRVYDIKYPRLKTLELYNIGGWILRHAPMLQELQMAQQTFITTPAVLDTIPSKLKELRLTHVDGSQVDNKSPIVKYLHRFIHHPHLCDLVIHTNNMNMMGSILDVIGRLRQLRSLLFMYDEWDPKAMESFFSKLSHGCPHLAHLGLNSFKAPSAACMLALKPLANLKTMSISIAPSDGDPTFFVAMVSLLQLQSVHVDLSKGINKRDLHGLRDFNPNVKIIPC
ncbi:hypothetical protein O0I10_006713 [Lichtheimia ornata]|uniref:Uncharacterized protein n=1 Tax=Lichtheimia ornata TaxID=688661 RepID=A0AAD7V3W1_9FUNG|nr:uncharacterized protein O0I10_006713 [Lichtheimia ornata]KAJ8657647.1 hypothetical protein O0I10_006713 [Lichtheimia ornata]